MLVGLELVTGGAALVGGLLLIVAPDGSLMQADTGVLAGSPFHDWRVPGVLLGGLVGLGFLGVGAWQWSAGWHARELSAAAGLGLIGFEAAEWVWLGFQPLELVFALVGACVTALAWRARPVTTRM